jgi:DNA-binding transcriptional ArsR family regulator
VLKLRFTTDDLARIRLAPEPAPLWDVLMSAQVVQGRPTHPQLVRWKQRVLRRARRRKQTDLLRTVVETLGEHPQSPSVPDVVSDDFHDALTDPASDAAGNLDTGQAPDELSQLAAYYQLAIRPHNGPVGRALRLDWELQSAELASAGLEQFFAGFAPSVLCWASDGLEVSAEHDGGVELGGRGLLMVPSVFCWPTAAVLDNHEQTPVLIYPASASARAALDEGSSTGASEDRLAALIGSVRARILSFPTWPTTTTRLAQRLGLAQSTVSDHIRALRAAGLIESTRRRNEVFHSLTDRGRLFRD